MHPIEQVDRAYLEPYQVEEASAWMKGCDAGCDLYYCCLFSVESLQSNTQLLISEYSYGSSEESGVDSGEMERSNYSGSRPEGLLVFVFRFMVSGFCFGREWQPYHYSLNDLCDLVSDLVLQSTTTDTDVLRRTSGLAFPCLFIRFQGTYLDATGLDCPLAALVRIPRMRRYEEHLRHLALDGSISLVRADFSGVRSQPAHHPRSRYTPTILLLSTRKADIYLSISR